MKADDPFLSAAGAKMTLPHLPHGVRPAFVALAVALLLLVGVVHRESWADLVSVWERSVSYNHCFLVFPVSVWLMYRERSVLASLRYRPFWFGLPVLGILAILWLFASVTGVNSLRDFAIVATVPVLTVTILGADFGRAMRFPLAFTLFAWPFGEVLIPPFIDLTADFTVAALRMTGVPVYREGNSLIIPTGQWSVVQECSGIRYLMASAFAGTVFAHINMRSRPRWIAFVTIAVIAPIVANWVRAYLTVLLGHLTDNRLAVGVDHLIYGWVFFGIVMTGVFLVGARMADAGSNVAQPGRTQDGPGIPKSAGIRQFWIVAALVILTAGLGPLWKSTLDQGAPVPESAASGRLPAPTGTWQSARLSDKPWLPPEAAAAQSTASAGYTRGQGIVTATVSLSTESDPERKLLAFAMTTLSDYDPSTQLLSRKVATVPLADVEMPVVEKVLRNGRETLVVWYWYRIGDTVTASVWQTRILRAFNVLAGRPPLIEVWTLSHPAGDDIPGARQALGSFVREHPGAVSRTAQRHGG